LSGGNNAKAGKYGDDAGKKHVWRRSRLRRTVKTCK
jgi:hypothetical protein